MPFINKVGGGSGRRFGLSRRSVLYTCGTHTAVVTLNNTDKKCYYPANYSAAVNYTCNGATATLSGTTCIRSNYAATATTTQQGPACYSGGAQCGNSCVSCVDQAAGCGVQCNGWCAGDCNSCQGINFGNGNCGNQGWQSSYSAYYINVTSYSCPTGGTVSGTTCINVPSYSATANYSCPTNTGIATVSGTNCVYPATYNATVTES